MIINTKLYNFVDPNVSKNIANLDAKKVKKDAMVQKIDNSFR